MLLILGNNVKTSRPPMWRRVSWKNSDHYDCMEFLCNPIDYIFIVPLRFGEQSA